MTTAKTGRTTSNLLRGVPTSLLALVAGSAVSTGQNAVFRGGNPETLNRPTPTMPTDQPGEVTPFTPQRIAPPSAEDVERLKDDVKVDSNELVELHVREEDLQTVLQMLSIQGERSVVATQNVAGTVTADLYGVTFREALDAILIYNGFGYIEQGGVIYVMPLAQIEEEQARARKRETVVLKLNYLNAVDAAQFAQPLLSEGGTITTNGQTADFSVPDNAPVGADSYALGAMLVVNDYAEHIEEVRALLTQLDSRPESVLVECTILQNSINEANAWGVDFSIIDDVDFADFTPLGGPLRVIDGLISGGGSSGSDDDDDDDSGGSGALPDDNAGGGAQSTVGGTGGRGGFKAGIVSNNVSAFIRLLDEVGDTTIISNPKILTLNRQPARVQVGRRVGYLSTTTTDTSTSQTVEFLDTGTQLFVRPFCSNDGYIRLELRPEVSQPIIRTVSDSTGAPVTIPDEDTSHIVTNVVIRDGQTVVLGGLFTERTTAARRQIPFFGDMPLVGPAFRGKDDSIDRAEIVFVVTPQRLSDQVLTQQGAKAMEYAEDIRAGAREGLLPWSREKRSGQLLVEAERLAAHGDTAGALNRVQRSLALKPNAADAIRLRERLVGSPAIWPSRSVLGDVINDEVARRAELLAQLLGVDGASQTASLPGSSTSTPASTDGTSSSDSGLTSGSALSGTELSGVPESSSSINDAPAYEDPAFNSTGSPSFDDPSSHESSESPFVTDPALLGDEPYESSALPTTWGPVGPTIFASPNPWTPWSLTNTISNTFGGLWNGALTAAANHQP